MQRHELDTVQVPSPGKEPTSTELLGDIPGMTATIAQQSLELTELKLALQEIIQAFPPAAPLPLAAPEPSLSSRPTGCDT